MDEPLHPSTLSEILDRTAQLYRARFLVYFGIAFIPTATLLVFAGAVALFAAHAGSNGAGSVFAGVAITCLVLVGLPALLVTTALANAALSHAAARAVFAQSITIRDSYRAVWPRGWRYIGLLVMQFAAVWMVPVAAWTFLVMIAAGLAALAGGSSGGLFALATILVVLGLVAYGFWMALQISLAFPACVVEQSGALASLKRSWSLGAGSRGRILLLYLLGAALNWILSIAIWVPFLVLLELLPGESSQKYQSAFMIVRLLVIYGAGFAVQAFTRPVYGIALMLFYYDQRMRREGFDIEWMMLKAGLVVPPPLPPPPTPPPVQSAMAAIVADRASPAVEDTTASDAPSEDFHAQPAGPENMLYEDITQPARPALVSLSPGPEAQQPGEQS
jgi:hypothetical protein